jgi:hypothetical protein
MFGIDSSYYNESVRKLVLAFGSLFNEIYLSKFDESNNVTEKVRVPITYGPKEKFLRKLREDNTITDNQHVQITLPRLGFDITTYLYDPTRKVNKLKNIAKQINGTEYSMWSEVPYNINFNLYLFTRNVTDTLQIVEQILPNFAPDFTVSLNMNPLSSKVDVPFVLNSVATNEDFEGDFSTRRLITSVFDFTAKTYVYGQIKQRTPVSIETSEVNFFDSFLGSTASPSNFITDFGWTGNAATGSVTMTDGSSVI